MERRDWSVKFVLMGFVCVSVKEDKSEHFRIESMVMTWFYVASWRRI